MKLTKIVSSAVIALATFLPAVSHAAVEVVINPTSDGSIYTCASCNSVANDAYVLVSGYIQGVEKFSSAAITQTVTKALLSVNPYGLPLWGKTVDIYGYGTTNGQLSASDGNAGTFLGTLTLPANLAYGQDAYFDVTSFVAQSAASSPYLAFNFRSTGTDVFSSLEYNYGHASQLLLTTVPEPEEYALMLAGLALVGTVARRRRQQAQS